MSEVNVQIQNPNTSVSITEPEIHIHIEESDISVLLEEGQPLSIQVQNPVIEVNMGCCSSGNNSSGHIIQNEGVDLPAQARLNFIGAGVTATDNAGVTDITIPGGGGGASYTEITYNDMVTAVDTGTLTPGGWYLITDASGTDLGFLTYAVNENTISVQGVGGYLNADFQAAGDYTGVEAETGVLFMTPIGIWRQSFEEIAIPYMNLTGGTFAVGDTITGQSTGATAVITSDNGTDSMTVYMTSPGVAFDGSEVLDNGGGVSADMNGAAGVPDIQQGDVVIWNLLHYQLTDISILNGDSPESNTAAYTLLAKTAANVGYITAWDVSEFDFVGSETIEYRQDLRGGLIRGAVGVAGYQFGRDDCAGNNIQSPATFDIKNLIAAFNNNTTFPGAVVSAIVSGSATTIENNILENGASLAGITAGANCSISKNKIGQGAVVGGSITLGDGASIDDMDFAGNSSMSDIMLGSGAQMFSNVLYPSANISLIAADSGSVISNNIIENGGLITDISAGLNCSISRNKVGQGATLGGTTTLSDNASINENEVGPNSTIGNITAGVYGNITGNYLSSNSSIYGITLEQFSSISATRIGSNAELSSLTLESSGAGAQIINCEIGVGAQISNKTIQDSVLIQGAQLNLSANEMETIITTIDVNRSVSGFSNVPSTIDITGLTTIDCTAAFAQYRGIYNLTSGNATESIDTITNPPTAFPFTIRPEAGITLTITGTAYAGIGAGQIALKATDYTLDGDKGEYIVLEIDPLGTGALIEKYVGNGLI